MVHEIHTDGIHPSRPGTAKTRQTCQKPKGTGASAHVGRKQPTPEPTLPSP